MVACQYLAHQEQADAVAVFLSGEEGREELACHIGLAARTIVGNDERERVFREGHRRVR